MRLSIFPDRDSLDEDYMLTLVFTDASSVKQTNTVPIHVIDQDVQRPNDSVVTVNFDRDQTAVFTNAIRRALTTQMGNDWAYFFTGMNLDPVAAGSEQTYIWSNNFSGGRYFTGTNTYTGCSDFNWFLPSPGFHLRRAMVEWMEGRADSTSG